MIERYIKMTRVCVATLDSRAYYSITSTLKRAGIRFGSSVPGEVSDSADVVLTTASEASRFGKRAMIIEGLSDKPGVLKGQIASHLSGGSEVLLVGVDPGTRIGVAAYYGETILLHATFGSVESLVASIGDYVRDIPSNRVLVRVGDGAPPLSKSIATVIAFRLPSVAVEIVDESGTSSRDRRSRGLQLDQSAASKIALRKGIPFLLPDTRTSKRGT